MFQFHTSSVLLTGYIHADFELHVTENTTTLGIYLTLSILVMMDFIEYDIFGEGSQISTNQKQESTVSSLLIGWNLWPFPENTVL